jgi:hypothetical protein
MYAGTRTGEGALMERVAQGGTVTLTAQFQNGVGDLVDPTTPTIDIIDADGLELVTNATPTRISLGNFSYAYVVPADGPVGIWHAHWGGTVDGAAAGGDDWFNVVVPGELLVLKAYSTLAALKSYLGISVATYDAQLTSALNAASRSIDNYCGRRFWIDASVVTRTFPGGGATLLDLPDGIGSTTGLVIKTDTAADGTFATTWAATDYQLLPVNAPYAFPEAEPWTQIQATGSLTFPSGTSARPNAVQITAKWGWPAVPDPVIQACFIKSSRLFHRKDSPQGIAGFGEFGPVRLSRTEDADVEALLNPYRTLVIA